MAVFDKSSTPALSFPSAAEAPQGSRAILWPVYGWRVVAPSPRPRTLNVFQAAVLRLAKVGQVDPDVIARLLELESELIVFIQSELRGQGWLALSGKPTPLGLKVLEADLQDAVIEETAGWVFADPETGVLWPRFWTGPLPDLELEYDSAGAPRLMGAKGQGGGVKPLVVRPSRPCFPLKPDPKEVLKAVRGHRLEHRRRRDSDLLDVRGVSRVSYVSEEPRPFFVLVRVFAADDAASEAAPEAAPGQGWDSRGMLGGIAPGQFAARLEAHSHDDPRLRDLLRELIGDEETSDVSTLAKRAEFDIETEMSSEIRRFPAVFRGLVALQRAWMESQLESSPADKLDDVIVKAQKAAEAILDELLQRFPLLSPQPWGDGVAMKSLVSQLTRDLGFEALPKSLLSVRPGKIQAAVQGDSGLRSMTLALLLSVPGHDRHPLRALAPRYAELLTEIDTLATWRDQIAAHHKRERREKRARVPLSSIAEGGVRLARRLALELLLSPLRG